MNKNNLPLGDFLKDLRKDKNYSQETVAETIGITRQAYSQYELGKCEPSMDILAKLSDLYTISVEQFYRNGLEVISGQGLSRFEQKVIKSFSSLNIENQREIYDLILYKLARTLTLFI